MYLQKRIDLDGDANTADHILAEGDWQFAYTNVLEPDGVADVTIPGFATVYAVLPAGVESARMTIAELQQDGFRLLRVTCGTSEGGTHFPIDIPVHLDGTTAEFEVTGWAWAELGCHFVNTSAMTTTCSDLVPDEVAIGETLNFGVAGPFNEGDALPSLEFVGHHGGRATVSGRLTSGGNWEASLTISRELPWTNTVGPWSVGLFVGDGPPRCVDVFSLIRDQTPRPTQGSGSSERPPTDDGSRAESTLPPTDAQFARDRSGAPLAAVFLALGVSVAFTALLAPRRFRRR